MTTRRARDLGKAWAALAVGVIVAAFVAAIAGVALGAGEAQAATPTRATVEATQFTVQNRQTGEAFAVCPGKKRAVGGGVVQSGPASPGMAVRASGPLDATRTTAKTNDGDIAKVWYAAVYNYSGTERTFRVFALCSGTSKATIEATPITAVKPSLTDEQYAVCPGNKRALGGGVVQSGPADRAIYVKASGPLDSTGVTANTITGDIAKQWYAAVANYFPNGPVDFKVFAICSGDSSARIKATPFLAEPERWGERFAKCASTKRALGGGVVQSGPDEDLFVMASGPLDSTGTTLRTNDGDKATQWYAAVDNLGGFRELKVFAICE